MQVVHIREQEAANVAMRLLLGALRARQALGQEIGYFALPFRGRAASRLRGGLLGHGGYSFPGDDPFHLRRIGGEGQLLRLKNWLTVDPLKERRVRRYDHRSPTVGEGALDLVGTTSP